MRWFFYYIFPVIFIVMFITIFLSFISTAFFGAALTKKFFKSFGSFEKDFFNSFQNMKKRKSQNYKCSNCGAGVGSQADVSPSGDVKCKYCDRWFNIHENAS